MSAPPIPDCPECGRGVRSLRCTHCGARARARLPALRDLLADGFRQFLDFDRRLLRTLRALVAEPGALTVAYAFGDRERFVSPVRVTFLLGLLGLGAGQLIQGSDRGWLFHLVSFRTESLGNVAPWIVMVAALPLLAAITRVFVRGSRFATHLVFYLHLQSFFFLLVAIETAWIAMVAPARSAIPLLGAGVYLVLAIRRTYGSPWLRTSLHALVVAASYFTVGMVFVILDEFGWIRPAG